MPLSQRSVLPLCTLDEYIHCTVHPNTIHVAIDALKRLQTSTDLNEGERFALDHVAQMLAAHLADSPRDARTAAAEDGQVAPFLEAFQAVYRPSINEERERILRLHSVRNSEPLPSLIRHDSSCSIMSPGKDPRVVEMLSKVGSSSSGFDVFQLASWCDGRPLEQVGMAVLQQLGLIDSLELPVDKLRNFLRATELHYPANWYHSNIHAADVVQALAAIVMQDDLMSSFTELEMLSLVLSAIIHDVNHTGLSNDFLIKTKHELALTYNDLSVNENYHLATAFRLLLLPQNNFMEGFSKDDYAFVRSLVVDIVLSTDMKAHQGSMDNLKADMALFGPDLSTWNAVARTHALCFIMHCADISNAVKPAPFCVEWAHRVNEEFWAQGEKEKALGLPVSSLNNRAEANVPRSQMVFAEVFVRPCFQLLGKLAPKTAAIALAQCDQNLASWAKYAEGGMKDFKNLPLLHTVGLPQTGRNSCFSSGGGNGSRRSSAKLPNGRASLDTS